MAQTIEIPVDLARFELPDAVQTRLQALLDRQDAGQPLTAAERQEAEGWSSWRSFSPCSASVPRAPRPRRHAPHEYLPVQAEQP